MMIGADFFIAYDLRGDLFGKFIHLLLATLELNLSQKVLLAVL